MEYDNLIKESAHIAVQYSQASPSLFQRKLKMGYNRAHRIMEQLEELKVIGVSKGAKARDILFSDPNELSEHLRQIGII